jgi:putative ABC transport system permease protein
MFRNYLTTAFRNFRRHKAYSSINVLGLTVGLACTFFIVLWIQDEISYDRFHEDGDRIYAVMRHATFGGNRGTTQSMPKPLAEVLVDEYPEVTNTVLVSWEMDMLLSLDREAYRSRSRYVGADFF